MGTKDRPGSDIDRAIGENIGRLRNGKGLSQQGLRDKLEEAGLKVRRETVTQWENGTRVVKGEYIIKLAQVLGVSCDELLTGKKPQYFSVEEATGLTNETVSHLHDLKEADELDVDGLNSILMNPVFMEELIEWYSQLLGAYDDLYEAFKAEKIFAESAADKEAITQLCISPDYESVEYDCHYPRVKAILSAQRSLTQESTGEPLPPTMFEARSILDIVEYRFTRAASRMLENLRKEFSDKINASWEGES